MRYRLFYLDSLASGDVRSVDVLETGDVEGARSVAAGGGPGLWVSVWETVGMHEVERECLPAREWVVS